jgi:tetratricopeptide (TPR) repeat protein
MKRFFFITLLLIAAHVLSTHDVQAQEVKTVRKVVQIQKEQTFNLTKVWHSRAYLPIDIPSNTVEWYIAFTATPDNTSPNTIGLFSQLTRIVDPSGLTAAATTTLFAPRGTAPCNIMLTDLANRKIFMSKSDDYRYQSAVSRVNLTHGVIQVDGKYKGPWQILLYNPNFTTALNVTVEVTAVIQEQVVDRNVWSQANKDTLFNAYYANYTKNGMDAKAARELTGCIVDRVCRTKTPAELGKLSKYEREQLHRSVIDSCVQMIQGGPRTEQQDKARDYGNMGWKAYERGEIDKCIEYSKKALGLDPHIGAVQANLGLCYLIKGDTATAMDYYVDAVASHRKDKLTMKRHIEAEIGDIDQALKQHPNLKGYQDARELLQSSLPR